MFEDSKERALAFLYAQQFFNTMCDKKRQGKLRFSSLQDLQTDLLRFRLFTKRVKSSHLHRIILENSSLGS